jgi:hypothetical protein
MSDVSFRLAKRRRRKDRDNLGPDPGYPAPDPKGPILRMRGRPVRSIRGVLRNDKTLNQGVERTEYCVAYCPQAEDKNAAAKA